jgi:hypothetical protein
VQLFADNGTVVTYGQNLQKAGARPNPYAGIISIAGQTQKLYDKSQNWKTCAAIYEKYFHKTAPNEEAVIPGPNKHTLDITGSITDACAELTIFKAIGDRVGKYLNDDNWRNAVSNFGKIPVMQSLYGSIHAGKTDADDTFGLVQFDPSIPPEGDWKYLTKLEDVPGD